MSIGAFGENFPYSNFHDLNMDWIIKIAKDFLDQYTEIQTIITNGEESILEKTANGVEQLETKTTDGVTSLQEHYTEINNLLTQWYNTHSADIANQLASALQSLENTLAQSETAFNTYATNVGNSVIASIPSDYSSLANEVNALDEKLYDDGFTEILLNSLTVLDPAAYITWGTVGSVIPTQANSNHRLLALPVDRIRRVYFETRGNYGGLPIITVVNNSDATILMQYTGNPNSNKGVVWFPNGCPAGSKIIINDFNYQSATRIIDRITVEYEQIDYKIIVGRNKIDNNHWAEGVGYFYNTDGVQAPDVNIKCFAFPCTAGDILRVSGVSAHITFWKDLYTYVYGTLATTSVVPETANWCMISTTGMSTPTPIATLNDENIGYTPYSYKFRDQESSTGKQYRGYTPGNIYFTVPVNQKELTLGQESPNNYLDQENIVNVNSVLRLPLTYTPTGKETPVIMIFHGSGFAVNNNAWGYNDGQGGIEPSNDFNSLINTFINAGYAVCDINGYNNTIPCGTWGCPKALTAHKQLMDYVKKYYNVSDTFNIYGFSMGGIDALNFVRLLPQCVNAVALGAPIIYMYDQVYCGSAHWKEQLAIGCGFDVPAGTVWTDGTPTTAEQAIWDDIRNTWLREGFMPESDIVQVGNDKRIYREMQPIRIWHGVDDTVTNKDFTSQYITALRTTGKYASVRWATYAGHELCYGYYQVINNEIVYWFNRFN